MGTNLAGHRGGREREQARLHTVVELGWVTPLEIGAPAPANQQSVPREHRSAVVSKVAHAAWDVIVRYISPADFRCKV